jgi:3',5'-cyclic-nucleotide phosphodiesterase
MHLRVLGCHGGESATHRTTCFVIDDVLALDAGALTRGLSVPAQAKIEAVVLSHVHLDHIKDLALIADNIIGVRTSPLDIYCTAATAEPLEKHFFNNLIWPDFTQIPNPADPNGGPTVRINRIESGDTFTIGRYRIRTVAVSHPVDCQSIWVTTERGTLVFSGDTGPTDNLWKEVNACDDLRAFIYEVSFPNEMAELAEVSGHLTPEMMAKELEKYDPITDAPVLLYHMKPGFTDELKAQVADLGDPRLTMLKPMDEIDL